jgi:hypothetical protein
LTAVVKFSAEVALFCTTPLTLVPTTALIVAAPAPAPLLVIVPVLFTEAVESVSVPAPLVFSARFPCQ